MLALDLVLGVLGDVEVGRRLILSKRSATSPRAIFIQTLVARSNMSSLLSAIWSTMRLASSRIELKPSVIAL